MVTLRAFPTPLCTSRTYGTCFESNLFSRLVSSTRGYDNTRKYFIAFIISCIRFPLCWNTSCPTLAQNRNKENPATSACWEIAATYPSGPWSRLIGSKYSSSFDTEIQELLKYNTNITKNEEEGGGYVIWDRGTTMNTPSSIHKHGVKPNW